ncbi:MAG: emp24/gp25L/p24 family protein [Candidatus Bathyarchaeota archaeon]|nr:emp24/gp25L/p24 family protein [Candidatus Bathyarchaeota archaeon]
MRLALKKLVFLAVVLASSAIVSIYLTQQSESAFPNGSGPDIIVEDTFEVERNDLFFLDVELESNTTVTGYFEESSGMCVGFYILDQANFPRMMADLNFSAIISAKHAVEYNFTFIADQPGTYYFVFDNQRLIDGDVCLDKVIMLKLYRDRERA